MLGCSGQQGGSLKPRGSWRYGLSASWNLFAAVHRWRRSSWLVDVRLLLLLLLTRRSTLLLLRMPLLLLLMWHTVCHISSRTWPVLLTNRQHMLSIRLTLQRLRRMLLHSSILLLLQGLPYVSKRKRLPQLLLHVSKALAPGLLLRQRRRH